MKDSITLHQSATDTLNAAILVFVGFQRKVCSSFCTVSHAGYLHTILQRQLDWQPGKGSFLPLSHWQWSLLLLFITVKGILIHPLVHFLLYSLVFCQDRNNFVLATTQSDCHCHILIGLLGPKSCSYGERNLPILPKVHLVTVHAAGSQFMN